MRLKIRCDGKSWKILGFWVEVNKAEVYMWSCFAKLFPPIKLFMELKPEKELH